MNNETKNEVKKNVATGASTAAGATAGVVIGVAITLTVQRLQRLLHPNPPLSLRRLPNQLLSQHRNPLRLLSRSQLLSLSLNLQHLDRNQKLRFSDMTE